LLTLFFNNNDDDRYSYNSFIYEIFQTSAARLQVISLIASVGMYAGSRFFQSYFAKNITPQTLPVTIIKTSTVAAVVSMSYLWLVSVDVDKASQDINKNFVIAIIITILNSIVGEVAFLPSIMVASSAAEHTSIHNKSKCVMRWGILCSAIDFGDELSDWLLVLIVGALGIDRGNWAGLKTLVLICGGSQLASLAFVPLIKGGKTRETNTK